jgi:hypothetical protein
MPPDELPQATHCDLGLNVDDDDHTGEDLE